jgi:hypothetical protein
MEAYEPRGARVLVLLERMAAEPARIFSSVECAQIMGCKQAAVSPTLLYAVKARKVFKRNTGKRCEYSLTEMAGAVVLPPAKPRGRPKMCATGVIQPKVYEPQWATSPDDHRIGKVVPGWKPPVMRHVRGGQ